VTHFYVREPKNGYGSFPGCPLSKRTHFGRSACSSAAGSLAIVQFPHFFAPTHSGVHYGRVHEKKVGSGSCVGSLVAVCARSGRAISNPHFLQIPILVPVYGSTGAQRAPCPRAAPGTAPFAAPASGEPPAAARAARAALRDYCRRARAQPRRQRRLYAASPPRARHRAASCPSDAAPARPASRGVLPRPASRPGARRGRAVQGLHVRALRAPSFLGIFLVVCGEKS
jgi:hypothetical protein